MNDDLGRCVRRFGTLPRTGEGPMSDDLPERLRTYARIAWGAASDLMTEAADRIEGEPESYYLPPSCPMLGAMGCNDRDVDRLLDAVMSAPELQALRRDAEIGRWVREHEAETQPYLAYAGTTDELRVIRSAQMFRSKAIAAGDAKPGDET